MPGVSAATILVPKPIGFESGDKQRGAAVVSLDGVEVWDGSQLVGKGQRRGCCPRATSPPRWHSKRPTVRLRLLAGPRQATAPEARQALCTSSLLE